MADTQLSASSVWEWSNVVGEHSAWAASGARLKREGRPWAPSQNDQHQWLQVDLKKEKRITGAHTSPTPTQPTQVVMSGSQCSQRAGHMQRNHSRPSSSCSCSSSSRHHHLRLYPQRTPVLCFGVLGLIQHGWPAVVRLQGGELDARQGNPSSESIKNLAGLTVTSWASSTSMPPLHPRCLN